MNSCVMCGSPVPEGQGVCSMCYGDDGHGKDGYYREWAEQQQAYPSGPMCDICGQHEACASTNGYNVCSESCDAEASARTAPTDAPQETSDGE